MAKSISKGKSTSSRARAMRSSRALATAGRATTLDRDVDGVASEPDDDQPTMAADDAQDDEAYAAGDESDEPDDAEPTDDADFDDEDTDDARALALPDRQNRAEHTPTLRSQRGGVYVPEFLMRNPITRRLAEVYVELLKVTWPTRGAAWNMTLVVVAVALSTALILGVADFGLTRLVTWLTGLYAGG